jgi:hypothetical protein
MATATFVMLGALGIGAQAPPRTEPIEHITTKSPMMTSTARLTLRPVEIVIMRWSTYSEHRGLATTLNETGPVAFERLLHRYGPAGVISVTGAPDVTIRYAWSIEEPNGNRRIYLATDGPVPVTSARLRRFPDREPVTFVELRMSRDGDGEGRLSETARLSVNEIRNVIELRDYDGGPRDLLMVHSERPLD